MLKSCTYCHRIHDKKYNCGKKPKRFKTGTDASAFRNTRAWQAKREEIRERDMQLCQMCIRGLYNPLRALTYDGLSVHHVVPLEKDFDKRLDNDNLLLLCERHHKMADGGEIPLEAVQAVVNEQEGYPPRGWGVKPQKAEHHKGSQINKIFPHQL